MDAKIKAGFSYVLKQRDFEIQNYRVRLDGSFTNAEQDALFGGNPNNLLREDNLWTVTRDEGTYMFGNYEANNAYEGKTTTIAGYISNEANLSEKLKAIIGVRVEQYDQEYTGVDQEFVSSRGNSGNSFEDENVLSSFNFFPTVNLIYALKEKTNLRASFSRTIARPSFKEKSAAQIVDPLTDRTFVGNIDLVETHINNFDLRWERFYKQGQTLAISAFFKTFEDPIEMVSFEEDTDTFRPENVGDSKVYGLEIEASKNLGFISEKLQEFTVSTNMSFIESSLDRDTRETEGKENGIREGESIDNSREAVGQAPYLINVGLGYNGFENGIEAGVYYNVQGRTLSIVGINNSPDVYNVPFHSLNINLSKAFGPERKNRLSFKISNLLNDKREREYDSFQSDAQLFSSRAPGRTFSIGYSYSF